MENGFIATYKITNTYFEKLKKQVNYDISSQEDQCVNELSANDATDAIINYNNTTSSYSCTINNKLNILRGR